MKKVIEDGKEIEVVKEGDWIIFSIRQAELDEDGRIRQVELDVYKS